MRAWLRKHKTSHLIGVINVLLVLAATVFELVTINNGALYSKLMPILDLIHLVNFPVYWIAETIPEAVLGYQSGAIVFALVLFVVGTYSWPLLLGLLCRIDSFEIRKKAIQSEAT